MKLFNAAQIRAWDEFTMNELGINSEELMERAANACTKWIATHFPGKRSFMIFCGTGNNGGDGLAIARLLSGMTYKTLVYVIGDAEKGSPDFQRNLAKLASHKVTIIKSVDDVETITSDSIVIDAMFGSGLNRAVEGLNDEVIQLINASGSKIISVDVPSGLFIDRSSLHQTIVHATHTLSFDAPKLAFMMPENEEFVGQFHIVHIGLSKEYLNETNSNHEWLDEKKIASIYRPRKDFAHKGTYGHALLIAGSYGKIGAAVLAAKGCLRSGVGLLTMHVPSCGYNIVQASVPAAMAVTDYNSSYCTKIDVELSKYNVLGVGPGLGTASETRTCVFDLLKRCKTPLVLDADALNIMTSSPTSVSTIPHDSILTPHPKEFERVFGKSANDFDRLQLAIDQARRLSIIIVLKGHHTAIILPSGKCYFNSTGNSGMATGGMGDVLTGIITGLLAQKYSSEESALLGVYIHGLAGDEGASKLGKEALTPEDLIENLPAAWLRIKAFRTLS